jgi:hypothetical protein
MPVSPGALRARSIRGFSLGMYDFRSIVATELEALNYQMGVGKLLKIALVKFFTKSGTPWHALISRF